MSDTRATNNFVAQREADRLGLNLLESTNRIKVVNSRALLVRGVADTTLKVGSWQGKCSLMVVPLDDFDLILGVEFFVKAKAMIKPDVMVEVPNEVGAVLDEFYDVMQAELPR
ncbi:hypothetical protein LWI28_021940 [Acer negundo]|uniref:Uncharacterized protein n=1 Tax=Acer negundo TaxID=4023 RepID=A0AAD5NWD7_ACENE|nr:hypothetical protein LWI28_021940 [Acer negundo]